MSGQTVTETSRKAFEYICRMKSSTGEALISKKRREVYELISLHHADYKVGVSRWDVKSHFKDANDAWVPRIHELYRIGLIYKSGQKPSHTGQFVDAWLPVAYEDLLEEGVLFANKESISWSSPTKRLNRIVNDLNRMSQSVKPGKLRDDLNRLIRMADKKLPDDEWIKERRRLWENHRI